MQKIQCNKNSEVTFLGHRVYRTFFHVHHYSYICVKLHLRHKQTSKQIYKETQPFFVRSFVCVSDGVWHYAAT